MQALGVITKGLRASYAFLPQAAFCICTIATAGQVQSFEQTIWPTGAVPGEKALQPSCQYRLHFILQLLMAVTIRITAACAQA